MSKYRIHCAALRQALSQYRQRVKKRDAQLATESKKPVMLVVCQDEYGKTGTQLEAELNVLLDAEAQKMGVEINRTKVATTENGKEK